MKYFVMLNDNRTLLTVQTSAQWTKRSGWAQDVEKYTEVTFEGDVEVVIDVAAISRMVGGRAAKSKTGRSRYLSGMIKATRRSKREVSRKEL